MKTNKKGFTLIELLIVIAIIGILASVVLVSLSSARAKAQMANFKSQAASIQAKCVLECDGSAASLTTALIGAPANITVGTITSSCGPTGTGTFSIPLTSSNVADCTITVNESGLTTPVGTGCI